VDYKSSMKHNNSKKNISTKLSFLFLTAFVICCTLIFFVGNISKTYAQTTSFTFTAAGDYGGTSNTDTVLNAIKNSGANFHIAVGDFRYDSKTNESGWASYVKGIVGSSFPFEIIAGNHDQSGTSLIDNYTPVLPDHIGGVVGQYGKEYYYDYPPTAPYARFIFTATSEIYTYPLGSTHYNWVVNAIDDARAKGIKWITISHHKNCITAGEKPCSLGTDFFNMLLNKKVDLILEGHEHGYERSKQLKCAVINSYDATCVVNATNSLTKGAGTVIIVVGTGGVGLRAMNSADPEFPYFASTNDTAYGVGKFTMTPTALSYSFVRSAGGTFSDSFSITDAGLPTLTQDPTSAVTTTSPTSAPTITPTPSTSSGPTATLCPTLPTNTGTALLQTNIVTAGTYKIWSRIKSFDDNSNSYWLQIDDQCGMNVGDATGMAPDVWTWVDYQDGMQSKSITVQLSAGSHAIKLIGRETDLSLDRLLLTSDLTCMPTDMGGNCTGITVTPTEPLPTETPVPTLQPTTTPSPLITAIPTVTPTPKSKGHKPNRTR
jgi:hypothetical protein